jgi:hypothetical protein
MIRAACTALLISRADYRASRSIAVNVDQRTCSALDLDDLKRWTDVTIS